ncbi:MAG TPA: VWA domain-containing protein [Pirellulales bacterium]|nr:VWA domain-containing protein [Pirellulales bacterium]
MNDQHTLRDDLEDRLAEQALGELLGGKRPPDLSERILAAAARPAAAKRRPRARLALAASLLFAVVLGSGYAGYERLRHRSSPEDGKQLIATRGESDLSEPAPTAMPIAREQVIGGVTSPAPAKPQTEPTSRRIRYEKLAGLVDTFNHLMDEHRYAEAEIVAKRANKLAPDEPVAKQMALTVKMITSTRDAQDLRDAKEQGFFRATANVDIAAVPFDDERPYQFGPVKDWERLTKSRSALSQSRKKDELSKNNFWIDPVSHNKYFVGVQYPEDVSGAADSGQYFISVSSSDKNSGVSVEQRLKRPVKVNLQKNSAPIPLRDALKQLGEQVDLNFRVDSEGLANAPVLIELSQEVSVKSALAVVLHSLGMSATFEKDRIRVATYPSPDQGRGPGEGGDRYSRIVENPFLGAADNPLSTFSIDVDTASYAKVRRYLLEENALPPEDAVRIEELVNYFNYDLPQPEGDAPLTAKLEAAACPWQPKHRLLRVSLKAREIAAEARPAANLVFLLDVSGSMEPDDKLPRVRRAMRLLAEQLREQDRVAIVVYSGSSGLVLPSTSGFQKEKILAALESLSAGGSTNGGEGLVLAYETAAANCIKGGVNRVILCTDGDFNVGVTSDGELERLIEDKARSGVFLTVLGFGMGNHNDQMLEKLADKGNGNYGYIDTEAEARKLLLEQAGGTLVTVAKDVKLQLEFNPRQVAAYRLIGYEDRLLRAEDFNDDRKDAGELGAGHAVTALYELILAGQRAGADEDAVSGQIEVEPLKYQRPASLTDAAGSGELLTLRVKYKAPDGETSKEALEFTARDEGQGFAKASADFKFAAAVASFGMLLRGSEYKGDFTYDAVLEIAQEGLGADGQGYRQAFLEMVRKAKELANRK